MKKCLLWAQVPADLPFSNWWPQLSKLKKWSPDALVEKFQGADLHWSRVMDSAKSFSLFSKQKIILIYEADKALRGEAQAEEILKALKVSPNSVILQSSQVPPKPLDYEKWEAEFDKTENRLCTHRAPKGGEPTQGPLVTAKGNTYPTAGEPAPPPPPVGQPF